MKVNDYQKGDVIFRQGDYVTYFFRIMSGNVGVFVCYGTEN